MPLWGNTSSTAKVPAWLKNRQITDIFATVNGFVQRHYKGSRYWDEKLVATEANTASNIGNASISYVYFSNAAASYVQGANVYVTVVFNKVVTANGGNPTLTVSGSSSNATATYDATANPVSVSTNKLHFKFTVPAATQTLSILGQTIGGTNSTVTVVDSTSSNAVLSFTNSNVIGVTAGVTGSIKASANVAVA